MPVLLSKMLDEMPIDYLLKIAGVLFGQTGYINSMEPYSEKPRLLQEVDMSELKVNGRARVLKYTDQETCGKEGTIVKGPIPVDVGTAGVRVSDPALPPGTQQRVYLVELDDSSERIQCHEDWLEAI